MSQYSLFDFEQQLLDCWNINTDIDTLDEAVLETNITKDQIANILLGLKELYQLKFDKLHLMLNKMIVDSEFEQLMLSCWQVVDDLYLLCESIDETPTCEVNKDKVCNTLMGLKHLYDLKFNKLWDYFEKLTSERKFNE